MSAEPCIVAIDPGLTGAIAFFFPTLPDRVSVYDMPVVEGEVNIAGLASRIRQMAPTFAIIEQVGPMPRDGVRQAFSFGASYMAARAAVTLLEIPLGLVTPPKWKKHYRLPGGAEGKEASRALALRLFPACSDSFQLIKHHNRAEAALLARYAAETMPGAGRVAA